MKDFVIDKISWHSRLDPDPAFQGRLRERFVDLYQFLKSEKLLQRDLTEPSIESKEDFEIKSSDLTPEGLAVMKGAYSKWLKAVDRSKNSKNLTPLVRELEKVRAGGV